MRRLLLAAGLGLGFTAPSLADPATTTAWSNMRSAPNGHSRVVQSVPANAQIDVQNCADDWCHASWRNLAGYIPAFAIGDAGAPPPVFAAPPVVGIEAPVYVAPAYRWGGPYVGFGWGYGWRGW